MKAHPAWASWCKLVQLFTLTIQHTLRAGDVKRLDELQLEYSELFDAVPEYNGLKRPKHHFCSHVPLDAWRYGPPRGYWCFGYEHFNSVLKSGAKRCRWKNEVVSIARYWSMWSGRKYAQT